jgi:hypothetical protein
MKTVARLVNAVSQVLVRIDLWAIDHIAQPVVTRIADAGIAKYTLARGVVVVAVVAGWASTAWRLAFAPEADETLLRDMLRSSNSLPTMPD